jgi:hypothetical protein
MWRKYLFQNTRQPLGWFICILQKDKKEIDLQITTYIDMSWMDCPHFILMIDY